MYGRFTLRTDVSSLVEIFTRRDPELSPRFNIAPTSRVAVVLQSGTTREISLMRLGLVPSWSKDPKASPLLVNARAATVASLGRPRNDLLCFGAKIGRVSKGKR
ncbi:MAG TPA: SOS response-associated peptidase family protein [Planctomycetaceae bacterium]|jgi:putative SOS response-associated peptidase YedK|nr:SOS response-associated peptidase family protein [Planctomycetaceae bacterium]